MISHRQLPIAMAVALTFLATGANALVKLPENLRPPIDESLSERLRALPRAADYAWLSVQDCQAVIGGRWRDAEDKNFVSPKDRIAAESACTNELVAANRHLAIQAEQEVRKSHANCLSRNKINRVGVVIGMATEDVLLCGWGKPERVTSTGTNTEQWVYAVTGYENASGRLVPVMRTHYLNIKNGRVVSMPDGPTQRPF
jgi:hypothetical protein